MTPVIVDRNSMEWDWVTDQWYVERFPQAVLTETSITFPSDEMAEECRGAIRRSEAGEHVGCL